MPHLDHAQKKINDIFIDNEEDFDIVMTVL